MVLEFEWSEATADGKYPLNVYVDGKLVGAVENAMNVDAGLGKVSGVLQFNAQWTKTDSSNDTINATWGNVSVNEISSLYNGDDVNNGGNGGNGNGGDTNTDGNGDSATDAGKDNAPETEDKADDTASDTTEEKKGCGSSVAGFGLVAVLGTALTAVVATKKKED